MFEFSYHFGHKIMVEQSTQVYQTPMMRLMGLDPGGDRVCPWEDEKGQSCENLSCRNDEKGSRAN
jgi:hypothetical protein